MVSTNIKEQVYQHMFRARENGATHHALALEQQVFNMISEGKQEVVDICHDSFVTWKEGNLSDDPFLEKKYLCCCNIALATRCAISGGMNSEEAYCASDYFIYILGKCSDLESVYKLHHDMFAFFVEEIAKICKDKSLSVPVAMCSDYIYYHLHDKIKLQDIAEYVGLSPNYLCKIFKSETGITISDFINHKKIDCAKEMLKYSQASFSTISSTLAYGTQSYFIKIFKEIVGLTPKQYRELEKASGSKLINTTQNTQTID